ncbi:MAG TPA: hypothetical protein PKN33_15905 [Phycisphaerae bacterium]|nr:hypothetical protein [Phycisphaerae bacterium]
MSSKWGIADLWDTNGNLESFRKDRSAFRAALEQWQGAASTCIARHALGFCPPAPEFEVFTRLLSVAARELFQFDTPHVTRFSDLCFDRIACPINEDSPPTGPENRIDVDFTIQEPVDVDDYWHGFPPDVNPVPDPDDLNSATEEVKRLMEIVMKLPEVHWQPKSISQNSEPTNPDDSSMWAKVTDVEKITGINRGTVSKAATAGKIKHTGQGDSRRLYLPSVWTWALLHRGTQEEREKERDKNLQTPPDKPSVNEIRGRHSAT